MTLDDIIRNANGGKLASDTDNSNDTQPQEQSNPGLFDKISAFLSNAGQAYASADNPGAEIYAQTPYADNLTNEVHDQNMADGQNIYTVLAPNYTPRPLDDSVYTDIPGTPVDLGTLEDESVRNARMQDSADYMAANWPRLYGAGAGAVENGANVVGGIQNALGLGDSTLQNAEQFEKGMQDYRKQWDATYGDSYFLNPNNFANDAGAVVGSSAPILALSAMTPGALVAGGSRALTGALSRAGLGRLAMSKAGQALIADTVRTLPSSSLADSLSEYGGAVHDLMQKGMSEDEARAQAVPIFYKNMALDTAVLPLELGIAKGGKGLITGLLRRNAGENMGKGIAKGTARTGILSGLSGLTEGYQEGAQNALEDQTKGERDGGWYNPVTWTPEDWKSARAGFVGGALMGIPGNVATAYHPDTKQAELSPEAQTQVQDIKNTLMNDASYGNMDSDTYNSYLELANSGNPELIKLANDSLASWKEKQGISTDSTASTDMTAGEQTGPVNAEMEAEKDRIRQYLNDNTIDQMGGQENYDWLYNTLNSTDPDEVHKAYQTVVDSTAETQEQEDAQAEQQAESQPAGNVSINSDNPFIGYVVKAANDQGIDPKIALSIAARETGGDDVNAINMAPNGGLMQVTEESANDYGVNDLYPDWRDDPEQNAEAGMYILKKKIEEQGGDTWAGVRAYNGAGEAADQYLNQIQQNYDNLGDIGGSSWSDGVSGYDLPTQSDEITAQVETLKPGWKQALPAIGGILNDMGLADGSAISSAGRTSAHNAEVRGAEHSYHINDDERGGGDAVDIVLPEGTTEEQAQAVLDRFKSTGAFKEVLFHDAGSGYHLHLGGYTGGLNGMSGNVDSDMSDIRRQQDAEDRAFDEQEREINDDSRAAMNRIMNDNSVDNAFDETQRDTEAAKKQQEETLKALTSDTQEGQPAQTPETAQNQPQDVPDTTVDATAPIEQQATITGANTATKPAQQNQPVQTAQAQPIQTPAGTQDPRINKAIHDPAMLNLVTRAMNGDSAAKESAGKLNQNIVDAVQQHIIATALNAHQQRIAKAPAGKTETILSDDVKTEYPAQYKIVSADDITPSNNTDGSVNAFYPQQYQPRDRTRSGMRKQVEDMANKLNPSALGASSNANMGAPVINSQGIVLNGNGRTMALKSVYKGKPKQIKAYKDFLKQNAKSLGIDPATIDSIKNPVLVRQVADDAPVQDIINSKAGGSQMSAGETAKKDADRIKQSTLQLASDSSDLTQESNRKFVNSVLKDVASPEELNTLYTKTGKISQAGITRVKNAVFAKAYGDDFLLTKMSESTDNNIRNVMNSMLAVAPKVAMLNDGMEKGLFYSYPLSDVISGSAKTLISLREQNKPVKFYLEETSLISENENQNSINDVLQFIDKNKRSGKAITAFFNELCNEIELQGHPDQGALIPTENPTMEEVINIAEGKVENNGVQSLFDTGRSEGNQADQTSGRMADRILQGTSASTETNAGTNGSERKEESAGKTESGPEVAKGEANEENAESNHVNTEPQQTESKDAESTHAEKGSQSDVQEEVSKSKEKSQVPAQAEKGNKPDKLRNQLSDTPEVDAKYSVREANDQLTRSKKDLKAEIKEAFPNAKEIKDEGDRMTFTMPNGSHIVVDMKNEIVLTDKELARAKKDHHIDDNGNVVVEGYAEARGKDAYIALAQGSREDTGFHEAYHIAEDAVLTDREKAAIKKAIPDAEERADKYAEWVEARKHGRGTAWGKLFQKIKDFAAKMKTILTGAENVHNVFRKIESGEVWERNANGQNSGRRYSVTKPKDAAEEAREKAEQDAENTAVTLNDILTEARKIVPIYTKSKVGEKSPAKYHYDARQRAGFVPSSFGVGDIGSAIALHIDSIGEIKGANIELTKDIIEDRQMEQRNAKKYKSKVPPDISPSQARQEGVRNFGRLYFLDNERAKEKYPQYYDLFEKALDSMPEEKAGVENVLALQDQRVRQNPLLSAAAGISTGKPDSQLPWRQRIKKKLLHLYAQMVDETDPIGQLTKALEVETGEKIADEKDPHKRALMCNSVASARSFMLLDGDNRIANLKALNKEYKGAIKNKVVFADIIDKLDHVTKDELKKAEVKDTETLLGMYLIAARTEEIVGNNKDYIRPDGYSHETCMRILANAPQAIKDAATLFWKYNENLVNIIEQQGLITHEAAEGMREYKKYCPMYRDFNEGDSVDTHLSTINTGRGFINQSSGIKSLSGGSSRPVINPIDSMINMTTVLIGKCERNNVAKIMVQCAEDHGGLGDVIVRDPTITGADAQRCAFTVLVAGKKVVYRTTPELYESITQMNTNSAAFMSNLFGKFTDALRFGSTNTPSFMMANFIRDTVTAGINSKYGFTPLVDSFRGMWKLTHDKQFKADFYAQGVPMDTYIRNDIRGAQDFKKKLRNNLKKYPFGIRQAMWFMSATARKYNNVGELIEQGTRAGEFLKARRKGATDEAAGFAAREVSINFSRHGSVGKKVNRYIPFFNASIQGTDKFIRTFKENPKRAIWLTIKYIVLPSLACWAFNHDDDWYKDLDPTTKYLNWCIHIPGTDTYFLIPKPQEAGVMFGSGIEAVLNQFMADDPKAMKQWAWELAGVMTPGLFFTMIKPAFEWQRNYSLWTNHNLVPKRLEKLPSEQQYTNSTSELAKLLGDTWIAKNISVGDRHGMSPIAIDNFFSAWFGSMGRTLAKTLDTPIESLRGKDRPAEPDKYWYESPVIGRFVRNENSQRSEYVDRLYDLSDQMETDYKRSDSYAVQKGKKGAKVPTELAQVRTAMKTVSKLNKEIRDIQDNPKMSAEEKRTQIDTRKVKMRGIAKKAVLKLGD